LECGDKQSRKASAAPLFWIWRKRCRAGYRSCLAIAPQVRRRVPPLQRKSTLRLTETVRPTSFGTDRCPVRRRVIRAIRRHVSGSQLTDTSPRYARLFLTCWQWACLFSQFQNSINSRNKSFPLALSSEKRKNSPVVGTVASKPPEPHQPQVRQQGSRR
jgi:hypothetical protein